MLFDWLVVGQVIPFNPASSVRGPRYSIRKGKTPVLSAADARRLLDSIETAHAVGLRDRALIGLMVYSFARVSAVVKMRVRDYYPNGKQYWIRLHEKGGKFHEVPVHHTAEEYRDAYIEAAGIAAEKNKALFRTTRGRSRELTERALNRFEAHKMIKRRAEAAHARFVAREGRGQQLQRRLATEIDVFREVDLAHPARSDQLKDFVMTDGLPDHRLRSLVGNHSGGGLKGRRIDEAARVVVRPQKGFDFDAQRLIARAGRAQERVALLRPARRCGLKEFFDLSPTLRRHKRCGG
jgi:Phage integrase family